MKGKKSILVIASGYDTFSKHTLDQILRRLKEADVTIFCVGTGEAVDLYSPNGGGVGYLQAKNQLSTFARLTGGYAWFPRFDARSPEYSAPSPLFFATSTRSCSRQTLLRTAGITS